MRIIRLPEYLICSIELRWVGCVSFCFAVYVWMERFRNSFGLIYLTSHACENVMAYLSLDSDSTSHDPI